MLRIHGKHIRVSWTMLLSNIIFRRIDNDMLFALTALTDKANNNNTL